MFNYFLQKQKNKKFMFLSFLKKIFFSFLLLFSQIIIAQTLPCKEVIGYYPNWQWYDRAKLVNPTTIDYSKYTIINYAFFKPEINGSISSTDSWADDNLLNGQPNWAQGGYHPNTSIVSRAHNAGVKVVPSIGGWTLSDNFPTIAANATTRTAFANACVALIQQYNFDGIDIDWEYPGYSPNSGTPADKQNFTLFLQAIRSSLNTLQVQTGKNYLLTACFGASQTNMTNIEWANVANTLDCINLMSYDFFGTWDATTNHNAPLYAPAQGDPTFNINSAINSLLTTYNVPANKICAGLAFYGRSHITTNAATLHGVGTGQADKITFSADDGSPLFYNILQKQSLFSKYTDNLAASPYLLGKNGLKTFVSYDDTASIFTKATYIKNKNLRGCIIWEITGDYIETSSGSGVIAGTPLASAIKTVFCGNSTCAIPTNIIVTPNNTSAVVSWASTGATSYNIQYKLSTSSMWITTNTNTNSFTLLNLSSTSLYNVKIQSVCSLNTSSYSNIINFTTTSTSTGGGGNSGGNSGSNPCSAPATFNFSTSTFIPMGEIKVGQARLHPIWGTTVDAYIPSNKKTWAISMAHAAHLFRNVAKTDRIPANFYFATAAKESFCGCDNSISAAPTGTNYPFTFQAASTGDGCFQIENLSAYSELVQEYPQRFPVGQHSNLIGNANFETAALGKAYYDIFTVKYWETHKNWNPIGFFNTATDPNAAIKLMAVAYNRGLWYPELGSVLNTDRANALASSTISPYFVGNTYGYDYQNALSNYTNILGNNTTGLSPTLFTINPATNQPYNQFNSFYDPQLAWSDVDTYIEKIKILYPTVNIPVLKTTVQTTFNSLNSGGSISFRYQLGQVLNTLMLNLPADDPSANIATIYGCGWSGGGNQTNIPPLVNILQPTQNQVFTTPTNVQINASASDPDGTISKVEFYNGTALLATLTAAPYTFNWQNTAIGTYTLTAKATDNQGAVTTSSPITITISAPINQVPIVNITSPTQNQIFISPTNITINANASDPDGTVTKVDFYNGTTLLATDNTAPYSFIWQNTTVGTYTITAKATDNQGAVTTSASITFTIQNVALPAPTIVITAPTNNSIFYQPVNIPINASVSLPIGSSAFIKWVRFYRDGVLLNTDSKAPYSFTMINVPVGVRTLTAIATTTQNVSTTSAPIKITILAQGGNIPPVCQIIQPTQNQSFTTPANITITANATDANGTVSKVDFFSGTTFLGTDNTAPYSFIWQNNTAGTYTITVKATDNQGAAINSSPVNISITPTSTNPPCSQYAQYVEGTTYSNGSIVTNSGGVYSCNVPGWCSGAAWAYSPGIGTAWNSAWTQTGTCSQGALSCATIASYVSGTTYQTGSIVKNNNTIYQCQIPSWCSGPAIAYEPGNGNAWNSAWQSLGACPSNMPKISIIKNNNIAVAFLFPNPTYEELNIAIPNAPLGNIRLSIFDAQGRLIFTQNIDNQYHTFENEINTSDFVNGFYLIKIETSEWNGTWSVVKQ